MNITALTMDITAETPLTLNPSTSPSYVIGTVTCSSPYKELGINAYMMLASRLVHWYNVYLYKRLEYGNLTLTVKHFCNTVPLNFNAMCSSSNKHRRPINCSITVPLDIVHLYVDKENWIIIPFSFRPSNGAFISSESSGIYQVIYTHSDEYTFECYIKDAANNVVILTDTTVVKIKTCKFKILI